MMILFIKEVILKFPDTDILTLIISDFLIVISGVFIALCLLLNVGTTAAVPTYCRKKTGDNKIKMNKNTEETKDGN